MFFHLCFKYLLQSVLKSFNFVKLDEQVSEEEPLIQVCDIFAGMARFSREKSDIYPQWKHEDQKCLFPDYVETKEISKGEANRFKFIKHFVSICKDSKMGVSIDSNDYLNTRNPHNRINFWHYTPQHDEDVAPTK